MSSTNMFLFPKKSAPNQTLKTETLNLKNLDCATCAMDIDLALEEIPSVSSKTSYAKSETKISFDPSKTSFDHIKSALEKLGYL